jgi:hypothetical protein
LQPIDISLVILLILASFFFIERYYQFFRRSMQTPFGMVLVKLAEKKEQKNKEESGKSPASTKASVQASSFSPKIYLAGGSYSDWQNRVKSSLSDFKFYTPWFSGSGSEPKFNWQNLEAIHQCDWVLAYAEQSSLASYILSLEVGYAKGLDKQILLIDVSDENLREGEVGSYLSFIRDASSVKFKSIQEALAYLNSSRVA